MKMKMILVAAGVLALAACDSGSGDLAADGETGGLRVTVHNTTELLVERIDLEFTPTGGPAANLQPFTVTIDDQTQGVGRDSVGTPATWTYTAVDLPVGTYSVTVKAFNASSDQTFYAPTITNVDVFANSTTPLEVFLRQELEDEDAFKTPFIDAVTFASAPIVQEAVEITVTGSEGNGVLLLTASGDGNFSNGGDGTGNAATAGATIDWTPAGDTEGLQTITFTLTDESDNTTSLTITVWVDFQRGDVTFEIQFNHAPNFTVTTEIVNDDTDIAVTMVAGKATDAESDPTTGLDIVWDTSDCENNAGFTVTTAPAATIDADNSDTNTLVMTRASAQSPITCTVEVTVSDKGLDDDPSAISSRTKSFLLTAGTIPPTGAPTQPPSP